MVLHERGSSFQEKIPFRVDETQFAAHLFFHKTVMSKKNPFYLHGTVFFLHAGILCKPPLLKNVDIHSVFLPFSSEFVI